MAFPGDSVVKNMLTNAGDRFHPWIGKIPCKQKWQPIPAFLSGEFHGERSLAGYNPWGHEKVGCNPATKQQQQRE